MNILELNSLTKYYGSSRGIRSVSLSVKQGEIFGFIGPNGAGKSTTIRTILGLITQSSGSITLFGKDAATAGPHIRDSIGYLPSEVFYYDNMKVLELLLYSASFYPIKKAVAKERIALLAQTLELPLNKKIDELSYGNKKKVGIIQGLLHKPKLIILDEPTGGLDPLMQQTFFDLLRQENKDGATIFLSSHNLTEVQKMCHRVAVIKEGEIIRVDTVSTLIDHTYKRIRLRSKHPLRETDFKNLTAINDFSTQGEDISFLYQGDINALLKKLAATKLENVLIEEPDLEEIFLHYYKRG